MIPTRLTICAASLVLLSAASASAEPAYVTSTVNLRAGAGTNTEIVGKIPGGSRVDATNCSDWCEVEWQGKKGFAIATVARPQRPPACAALGGAARPAPRRRHRRRRRLRADGRAEIELLTALRITESDIRLLGRPLRPAGLRVSAAMLPRGARRALDYPTGRPRHHPVHRGRRAATCCCGWSPRSSRRNGARASSSRTAPAATR